MEGGLMKLLPDGFYTVERHGPYCRWVFSAKVEKVDE
jgi:hypothetical protein